MQIGELARRTGVSRRSLRYYEQHRLLHAQRGPNGWRDYDEAAVARVLVITEMISVGLTLDDITQLAPCLDTHESSDCDNPGLPLRTYQQRLAVLAERLAQLQRRHDQLAHQIHALQQGDEEVSGGGDGRLVS